VNDIEQALRQMLHDQPPPRADPELLEVVYARTRRRRRATRAAAAGCTAGAVIAAAAITLLLHHGGVTSRTVPAASPGGTVPWTDQAAPVYTPPPLPSPTAPAAEFAACTAASLTGSLGDIGPGAGQVTQNIVLTNSGTAACTLSGGPSTLTGVRADGSQATLATGFNAGTQTQDYGLIGPANLQPGQSAQFVISMTNMCSGGTDDYSAVSIGIGTSGDVDVTLPAAGPLDVICSGGVNSVSGFGVPFTATDQVSSPLNVLTATAAMPATVAAGTTVTYTVTLQNPTGQAVALSPCPSYTQYISPVGTRPGSAASQYYLNCQAAPEIPAGSSVTFDMQIPAPAAAGVAKYGWALQGAAVSTGGAVSITGPSATATASPSS
jgi:hypothetical protein